MEGTRESSGHATEMPFLFGFRSAALPLPAGQHPSASHRHPVRNAHQSLSFGLKHKATEDGHVCAPKCRQVSRCPKEEAGPKDVLVRHACAVMPVPSPTQLLRTGTRVSPFLLSTYGDLPLPKEPLQVPTPGHPLSAHFKVPASLLQATPSLSTPKSPLQVTPS